MEISYEKSCLPILVTILVIVLPAVGYSEPMPVAAITVDGNASGWNGISPQFVDPQGDSAIVGHQGTDLKHISDMEDRRSQQLMRGNGGMTYRVE
jgi:hypothetical protein